MTYTLHVPSWFATGDKALAETEFSDVAEVLAGALLRWRFRPDSHLFENTEVAFVEVRRDGKPYMRFDFEMSAPKVRSKMIGATDG